MLFKMPWGQHWIVAPEQQFNIYASVVYAYHLSCPGSCIEKMPQGQQFNINLPFKGHFINTALRAVYTPTILYFWQLKFWFLKPFPNFPYLPLFVTQNVSPFHWKDVSLLNTEEKGTPSQMRFALNHTWKSWTIPWKSPDNPEDFPFANGKIGEAFKSHISFFKTFCSQPGCFLNNTKLNRTMDL